jgi:hypothetical protein
MKGLAMGAQAERMAREAARLHGLGDRFLARALLSLARGARSLHSADLARPPLDRSRYPVFMVWEVAPEIAARLGETSFEPLERKADLSAADGAALREWAWYCVTRSPSLASKADARVRAYDPWDMLRHDVANGNPMMIALDRLYPPPEGPISSLDPPARHVYMARMSRGLLPAAVWSPHDPQVAGAAAPEAAKPSGTAAPLA